ncbi:MAG: methionine--tRNA ligase [Candidatus Syntropharchaeia archaeon]
MAFPMDSPVLVTCGLPYANGPCHIGHLRTYIPGDVFVRFLRKVGQETVFVCGSDTHGTPIVLNAESQGISPRELVEKYHEHFEEIFKKLGIEFDNYGSTDSPTNHRRTKEIVKTLIERGYVYPKKIFLAYCSTCERFLPDRYVEGTCPYCGSPARGDECDQGCGRHLEPGEIKDPLCKVCGKTAEFREQEHFFFKLSEFKEFLEEYLENLRGTSNARNYAREWVKKELKDWCITRNMEWGVPFPGREDLVVYVWVDAPIGYISSTEEWDEIEWRKFWRGGGKIIHFIGGDIVYHHCIFWPAILKGAGYNLPWAVVASGMVKIEGKTFSKSRGYVVWVEDYLRHFHPDLLRYYLVSATSHTKELDFSWKSFQERINNELVAIFGNLVYRTLSFAYKNFGEIPDGKIDSKVIEKIEKTGEEVVADLDRYEFKRIVDNVMRLADFGNSYFQSHTPWHLIKEDRKKCGEVIKNTLQIIKALSIFFDPVMPEKMGELWKTLGMEGDVKNAKIEDAKEEVPSGQKLEKPKILFKKIEDEIISNLEKMIGKEEKEYLSIEEFEKLDIRIGEIERAERIEGSKKLLKFIVNLGGEKRQIVAGLARMYSPEELTGKQVVVCTNLEPVEIFGVKSEGMVLAAGDGVLIEPERRVDPGSKVR